MHDQRLISYAELFRKIDESLQVGRLPLTYQNVTACADELTKWYYDKGGLLMTPDSLVEYNKLREQLNESIDDLKKKNPDKILSNPDDELSLKQKVGIENNWIRLKLVLRRELGIS